MNQLDDIPLDQTSDAYLSLTGQAPAAYVLKSYTVTTLPSASMYLAGLIFVSNETGGATVAFSDGTSWRRCQDRAVVS
jgi:hypothetical protein